MTDSRVLEIEVAADGDHSTHEETFTVLLVGSLDTLEQHLLRAARLVDENYPPFLNGDGSASLSGTEALDNGEWRQFLDETQDDVLIGPEVPV